MNSTDSIPSQRELTTIDRSEGFPPLIAFKNKRVFAVGSGEETEA